MLLGTASFWEGVDVQGAALRLVVIDKIPFAPPDDPLVRARVQYLQKQGKNPFRDFQLPEAALAEWHDGNVNHPLAAWVAPPAV